MSRSGRAGDAPGQPERAGAGAAANGGKTSGDKTALAAIIVPVLTRQPRGGADDARPRTARSPQARLDEAVGLARRVLGSEGVLLLSPGAPSFPRYRDYTERGAHFARACGLKAAEVTAIPGLGIA